MLRYIYILSLPLSFPPPVSPSITLNPHDLYHALLPSISSPTFSVPHPCPLSLPLLSLFLPSAASQDIADGSLNLMMNVYRDVLGDIGGYLTDKVQCNARHFALGGGVIFMRGVMRPLLG
jgi:hypothetical protein